MLQGRLSILYIISFSFSFYFSVLICVFCFGMSFVVVLVSLVVSSDGSNGGFWE